MKLQVLLLFSFMMLVANVAAGVKDMTPCTTDSDCPPHEPICRQLVGIRNPPSFCTIQLPLKTYINSDFDYIIT